MDIFYDADALNTLPVFTEFKLIAIMILMKLGNIVSLFTVVIPIVKEVVRI